MATERHIKHNIHHPEFWTSQKENLINTTDRDSSSVENIIDATLMPYDCIDHMVADWCAVSEEKRTHPIDWAKNNINVRWEFTKEQEDYIYTIINLIW